MSFTQYRHRTSLVVNFTHITALCLVEASKFRQIVYTCVCYRWLCFRLGWPPNAKPTVSRDRNPAIDSLHRTRARSCMIFRASAAPHPARTWSLLQAKINPHKPFAHLSHGRRVWGTEGLEPPRDFTRAGATSFPGSFFGEGKTLVGAGHVTVTKFIAWGGMGEVSNNISYHFRILHFDCKEWVFCIIDFENHICFKILA